MTIISGRLFTDGALEAITNDPSPQDPQYNGWKSRASGESYVIDLLSDRAPASADRTDGVAIAANGALYVTTDAVSLADADVFNGFVIRRDGALHVTVSGAAVQAVNGWNITATGQALTNNMAFRLIENGNLSSLATVTRADPANYFDSAGLLKSAAANTPRTNYISGVPYLWIDGAVTEISGRSADIDNWNSTATAKVAKNAIGLDGEANTGWTLTDDSDTVFQIYQNSTTIVSSGATYFMCCAVQKNISPDVYPIIQVYTSGGTGLTQGIVLNPANGNYVVTNSGGAVAVAPVLQGDYWVFVLSITDNSSGNNSLVMRCSPAFNSDGTTSVDATAQGSTVFGYCGLFATNFSIIPVLTTGGTPKTVAADNISLATSAFGYNQSEGCLVTSGLASQIIAGQRVWNLSDGTSNQRMFHHAQSNLWLSFTSDGGVTQENMSSTVAITAMEQMRSAYGYKLNEYGLSVNGVTTTTDGSATVPTVTILQIGANQVMTNNFYGGINALTYYRTRFSNAQLQALSA